MIAPSVYKGNLECMNTIKQVKDVLLLTLPFCDGLQSPLEHLLLMEIN